MTPGKPFKPGTSGNPKGRPAGKTLAGKLREAVAKDFDGIVQGVITMAKSGDMQAASLLLNRVAPPLRPVQEPVHVALDGETLTAKAAAVVDAVGRGELAPDAAKLVLDGLAAVAKITEVDELAARVAALEEKA